jgi:hypothetical protein
MRLKRIFKIVLVFFFFSLPVVAFMQRLTIFDWFRLHGYQPPIAVSQLAAETTMQPYTKHLFYVYHPLIEDKAAFNTACHAGEQTIVLGCYIDGFGIHIFNVTDQRLAGVEQVTAAHETLHAAYARLSSSERKKVDTMTADAFSNLKDQRIKDTIELYRKQDAKVVPNELHSILGTEVRNLPINLENYYSKYFSNRLKVVSFSEQYEQAFTDRKIAITRYDAELLSTKDKITALQSSLSDQSVKLTNERTRLNNLRSSDQIAAYNEAVPGFNALVQHYNQDVDSLSGLINHYNEVVSKRNSIATEEDELVNAIDSRTTVPARQ